MNKIKNIEKYIILTVIFKQEENVWTAECKESGTATFGNTFEEVQNNMDEAIELHLNTLEDVNECERFLRENNIKIYERIPRKIKTEIPLDPNVFVNRDVHALPIGHYC